MGLSSLVKLCAEKYWKTMAWVACEGEVPFLIALRSVIGWRTTAWWRNRSAWGMTWDPLNVTCWKFKWSFHNRGVIWDTRMARMGGFGEDWMQKWRTCPLQEGISDSSIGHLSTVTGQNGSWRHSSQERKRSGSLDDGASENRWRNWIGYSRRQQDARRLDQWQGEAVQYLQGTQLGGGFIHGFCNSWGSAWNEMMSRRPIGPK